MLGLVLALKPPYPHTDAQSVSNINNQEQAVSQKAQPVAVEAHEIKPQPQAPNPQPVKPEPTPVVTPQPSTKTELMTAAGIPTSDWAAVDYIVSHESSWNQRAVNPSSGSCGLVQELPCGKSGCTFGDGVCQLRWATQYAKDRYGGWWGAYNFWQNNHWW